MTMMVVIVIVMVNVKIIIFNFSSKKIMVIDDYKNLENTLALAKKFYRCFNKIYTEKIKKGKINYECNVYNCINTSHNLQSFK